MSSMFLYISVADKSVLRKELIRVKETTDELDKAITMIVNYVMDADTMRCKS